MKINKFVKIIILLILSQLIVGCASSTIQLKMDRRNPTSYIFKYPITQIFINIDNGLHNKYMWINITNKGEYLSHCFAYSLDSLYAKNYDYAFHLIPYESSQCFSKEYVFPNNDSVRYSYRFLVLLTQISRESTLCEIITTESRLIVGETLVASCLGRWKGDGQYFYQHVNPSSIEEYEVLLDIGKTLGCDKEMAPLILPKGSHSY